MFFDGNEKLSLHKMSAKNFELKLIIMAGIIFYVMNNGELIPLNDLRYQYDKEFNDEK